MTNLPLTYLHIFALFPHILTTLDTKSKTRYVCNCKQIKYSHTEFVSYL